MREGKRRKRLEENLEGQEKRKAFKTWQDDSYLFKEISMVASRSTNSKGPCVETETVDMNV